MLKSTLATAVLGLTLFASVAAAKNDDSQRFMKIAAQNNLALVAWANIALKKAENNEITDFAKMMIEHHGNASLIDLAKKKNVSLPDSLNRKNRKESNRLTKLNDRGRMFDHRYIDVNLEAHQHAVAAYKRQAKSGTDADVRAFAENALPNLKKHLELIKTMHSRVNTKSNQ